MVKEIKRLLRFIISFQVIGKPMTIIIKYLFRCNFLPQKVVKIFPFYGKHKVSINGKRFWLFSNGDDHIAKAIYFDPSSYDEYVDLIGIEQFINRSKVFIDIGANTGIYSLYAASTNPNIKVVAFEPYSVNRLRLTKNVELNSLQDQIKIAGMAIGDQNGHIDITVPNQAILCDVVSVNRDFTSKFYQDEIHYKQENVSLITLDSYVEKFAIKDIDFIKIDAEDFEIEVLKGALETLSQNKPVILIESFLNENKINFYIQFILSLEYRSFYNINSKWQEFDLSQTADLSRNILFSPIEFGD